MRVGSSAQCGDDLADAVGSSGAGRGERLPAGRRFVRSSRTGAQTAPETVGILAFDLGDEGFDRLIVLQCDGAAGGEEVQILRLGAPGFGGDRGDAFAPDQPWTSLFPTSMLNFVYR